MKCTNCESPRIATIDAKSSDLNVIRLGFEKMEGDVPNDMGIGAGDYIRFDWCLDCGTIQDNFPLPLTELETPAETDD